MNLGGTNNKAYAAAFAFIGNSLLKPMNQTEHVGLDPAFWDSFDGFGSDGVRAAAEQLCAFAEDVRSRFSTEQEAVREISVEYTELFVGPPKPLAAPWETFYRAPGVSVGFGEATFQMRQLLREAGLEVDGDANQYADHMGIELLYLSVLFERAETDELPSACRAFADAHPLSWIGQFEQRIAEAAPDGYYRRIVELGRTLLESI